jgi:hypothetical protein
MSRQHITKNTRGSESIGIKSIGIRKQKLKPATIPNIYQLTQDGNPDLEWLRERLA